MLLSRSKLELQPELDDPRVQSVPNDPEGGVSKVPCAARQQPVGMIKRIEELCSKLGLEALCDRGVLANREIPVNDSPAQ